MSKILIAYFSVEGTTAAVAKGAAEKAGADLFEIKPLHPYTAADIRYTNPLARCNKEKLGKKSVPVLGKVDGFPDYDVVFVGFPIWYVSAPNVVNTFCKETFCETSGGSLRREEDRLQRAELLCIS